MIPANEIKAWSNVVPWITDEQIEQDLVLSRALVEIFSNDPIEAYEITNTLSEFIHIIAIYLNDGALCPEFTMIRRKGTIVMKKSLRK